MHSPHKRKLENMSQKQDDVSRMSKKELQREVRRLRGETSALEKPDDCADDFNKGMEYAINTPADFRLALLAVLQCIASLHTVANSDNGKKTRSMAKVALGLLVSDAQHLETETLKLAKHYPRLTIDSQSLQALLDYASDLRKYTNQYLVDENDASHDALGNFVASNNKPLSELRTIVSGQLKRRGRPSKPTPGRLYTGQQALKRCPEGLPSRKAWLIGKRIYDDALLIDDSSPARKEAIIDIGAWIRKDGSIADKAKLGSYVSQSYSSVLALTDEK